MDIDMNMSDAGPIHPASTESESESDGELLATTPDAETQAMFQRMWNRTWGPNTNNQRAVVAEVAQSKEQVNDAAGYEDDGHMIAQDDELMDYEGMDDIDGGYDDVYSSERLRVLHEQALANLEIKLRKISKRVFWNQQKPTIWDIYGQTRNTHAFGVPLDIELPFLFRYYAHVSSSNFQALGDARQAINVSRAIWFWQLDDRHSFTLNHREIRYNLLLIACTLIKYRAGHIPLEDELREFIELFFEAWKESESSKSAQQFIHRENFIRLWKYGNYDLVIFSRSNLKTANELMYDIKKNMPPVDEASGDLMGWGDHLSFDELETQGPAFALQMCIYYQQLSREKDKDREARTAKSLVVAQEKNLAVVPWTDPLVAGLLVDVGEPPMKKKFPISKKPWMGTNEALDVLRVEVKQLAVEFAEKLKLM